MVDREGRSQLAIALRQLADGECTNDAFYSLKLGRKDDISLYEIWLFGQSLFDSIYRYRLTGRHAVEPKSREMVERCLSFLQTDLEYKWPAFPTNRFYGLTLIFGVFLKIIACLMWYFGLTGLSVLFLCSGLLTLLAGWIQRSKTEAKALTVFWRSGDREVWPFLTRGEYEQVVKAPNTPQFRDQRGN